MADVSGMEPDCSSRAYGLLRNDKMKPHEPGYKYLDASGKEWTVTNVGWPGYTRIYRAAFCDEEGNLPNRDSFEEWLRGLEDQEGQKPFENLYWEDRMERVPVLATS